MESVRSTPQLPASVCCFGTGIVCALLFGGRTRHLKLEREFIAHNTTHNNTVTEHTAQVALVQLEVELQVLQSVLQHLHPETPKTNWPESSISGFAWAGMNFHQQFNFHTRSYPKVEALQV